jgi:protein arginine kinase
VSEPVVPWSLASARRGACWLGEPAPDPSGAPAAPGPAPLAHTTGDVVLSSRVRVARNLARCPFLGRATPQQREEVLDAVRTQLACARVAPTLLWVNVHELPVPERLLLVERHVMSKELAKGDEPRGLAVSLPDERLSIMVNEEDHLRIQTIRPGLDLAGAWAQASAADDQLEAGLDLAFSPRLGYLTACPTNVGTGVRMSVMLHLPALKLTGEIDKVKRAAGDMALSVRGLYGEGSEATGDLFQLSNQRTLGRTESIILSELQDEIVPRLVEYERAARLALLERRRRTLEDQVYRALGTLRHARLLSPDEALGALSLVRLGVLCGLITGIDEGLCVRLISQVQQAHLQKLAGRTMDQQQRREYRADFVRQCLAPR